MINKFLIVISNMFLMVGIMSGIMTYANQGFSEAFFNGWLTAFVFSIVCVAPFGVLLMSVTTKKITKIAPKLSDLKINITVGVIMTVVMGSIMATTTAVIAVGFLNWMVFLEAWLNGFISGIPFGLAMSLGMTLFIRPKLQKITNN
ncbi:MAG: DUF2798 domain-containing protein [Paracoccaceae bacterium]|nr:DUF2798 domain-containing protein [Paracoccaceae bacterium]